MPNIPFDEVWKRILAHQAEVFYLKQGRGEEGREFSYLVIRGKVELSRDISDPNPLPLGKDIFEKAYNAMPDECPSHLNVMGQSYVWGILSDTRISHREWERK